MCGLAGMARHPSAKEYGKTKSIVTDLLFEIRHRGRHATGIAAIGDEEYKLAKWAVDPAIMLPSDTWSDTLKSFKRDTYALLGHVRYATFSNATEDAAAHPYTIGATCGAHNGIVSNWNKLVEKPEQYCTDSEAIVAMLDDNDDARKVLSKLEGDFALSWAKSGRIWLARNEGRPLACAYVRSMQTLFWCSERAVLDNVLRRTYEFGGKDFDIWEPNVGTIYAYDVDGFDAKSANAEKIKVKLKPIYSRSTSKSYINPKPSIFDPRDDEDDGKVDERGQYGWHKGSGWGWKRPTESTSAHDGDRPLSPSERQTLMRIEQLEEAVARLEEENEKLRHEIAMMGDHRCTICGDAEPVLDLVEIGGGDYVHERCLWSDEHERVVAHA